MVFSKTGRVANACGQLALIVAALFTGAAGDVSVAQQPAHLGLDDRALLTEWKPAYKTRDRHAGPAGHHRLLVGLAAWWQRGHWVWLLDAVILIANARARRTRPRRPADLSRGINELSYAFLGAASRLMISSRPR